VYADGHEDGWLVVTTNEDWSAHHVRDLYGLRTDIEQRFDRWLESARFLA